MAYNNKGWKSESARHSLARKGIKTGRKKPFGKEIKKIGKELGRAIKFSFGTSSTAKVYRRLIKDRDSHEALMEQAKDDMDYAKIQGNKDSLKYHAKEYKYYKEHYDNAVRLLDEIVKGKKVA